MWEARNQIKEEGGRVDIEDHDDDELSSTAHSFFERELRTLEKPQDCALERTTSRRHSLGFTHRRSHDFSHDHKVAPAATAEGSNEKN